MFCDITDLAFPNYSFTQEVQPDFTDDIHHYKMFLILIFSAKKFTTVLSITFLHWY